MVISPSSSVLDPQTIFPFELDDFQKEAIAALDANRSVVVCAPTGSGKTLIGEYAIHRALAQGKRVFYTTPLKALSNQKLRDFREQFGQEQVGLLTGDLSMHREAPILVMTTEIFRNMLYGTPIGEVGTSLVGVETVVLDECHYMNDRDRGTVWEESIIYCPPSIQLVALSATIANSDQLTDWLRQVHGPTDLIYSDFRPVPLAFSFCTTNGLFPLLNEQGTALHPSFKAHLKKQRADKFAKRQIPTPSLAFILSQLRERDMLPAIYFIFSRRGCDKSVQDCEGLSLVNPEEARLLKDRIDEFLAYSPEAARTGQVDALYRGIAAHHAGLLPAWKGLVEELFQQGLVKVVFATETLAAGINMPARTTVISSLSKRTDQGHRPLHASEFLQMAGRAGRRGMDAQGYVVAMQTKFEGAKEAAYLATAGADPLVSQFTPSYGMVLNLLQTHALEEAKDLVQRSFGRYLAMLTLKPQEEAIALLQQEINDRREQLQQVDWKLYDQYDKLKQRLKEEKRLFKILLDQADDRIAKDMGIALAFAVAGTILSIRTKQRSAATALPAVLVTKIPGSGQFPHLVCVGVDNYWYVVAPSEVVGLHGELSRITEVDDLNPPPDLVLKPGQYRRGQETTWVLTEKLQALAARYPLEGISSHLVEEVQAQAKRLEAVEQQIQSHPVHTWEHRANLGKKRRRLEQLETELHDRQAKLDHYSHRHWEEFLSLMQILQDFEALEGVRPTPLGESVAAIRGENELWLGLALRSGYLDQLAPHHLAAACQALVTDVSRPDTWTRYPVSNEVEKALESLRHIRRRIFQLQHRHQMDLPVWYELRLTGLINQWALQAEWSELCENTSLDDGDIVRVLRRTLDLLHQIPHVPHLSDNLKQNADRAIHLIDRFPVRELIEVPEEEEDEEQQSLELN